MKEYFDNRLTSEPRYQGLQHLSQRMNLFQSSSQLGIDILHIVKTLAVHFATFPDCSRDDGKSVAETASDAMVLDAVQELSSFSLPVSQQTHFDLSLRVLDNARKRYNMTKGAYHEQNILKSSHMKVEE